VRPKIFQANYNKMARDGDMSKNVLLAENDIVYVPATIPAAISLKLEEFLRPLARAFTGVNMMQTSPGDSGRYVGGGVR
jgi:hypothetical protein